MVLKDRQVSTLFGALVHKLGGPVAAGMALGRAPSDISNWGNPSNQRQAPLSVIVAAAAQAGDFQILDVANQAAGRSDETCRLRATLVALRAQIDQELGDE